MKIPFPSWGAARPELPRLAKEFCQNPEEILRLDPVAWLQPWKPWPMEIDDFPSYKPPFTVDFHVCMYVYIYIYIYVYIQYLQDGAPVR